MDEHVAKSPRSFRSRTRFAGAKNQPARQAALLDQIPVAAYVCDVSGYIREFNREAERLWGRAPDLANPETRFCGSFKLYRPDGTFLPHAVSPIAEVLRGKMPRVSGAEVVIERPDGSRVDVVLTIAPVKNEKGKITGAVCCLFDSTVQKQARDSLTLAMAELREANAAVERAGRTKDEFLAALSHELRTPLTPVLLTAAALRTDPRLPAELRPKVGMIERNIALEARLIDDLLDLTLVARGRMQLRTQPCDVHALIALALEIVGDEARAKGIAIDCSLQASHSRLNVDPARFQQVIWNLLRNAVKFTPDGGHVSVATRDQKLPSGETWLRLDVSDSGVGIDASMTEKIFLPFEQGSQEGARRFGGLGLGLAIAKSVVEQHGGKISAQSEGPDRGATFIVELPGAAEPARSGSPAVLPADDGSRLGTSLAVPLALRILLVEDHRSTRDALSLLLRADGFHVISTATVGAALAAASASPFDLVLADLGLPDGSGNELMRKLQDRYALPGIALSGYGMEQDIARSRAAGFATHLVKPIAMDDLRRAIASAWSGRPRGSR